MKHVELPDLRLISQKMSFQFNCVWAQYQIFRFYTSKWLIFFLSPILQAHTHTH